MYKLILEYNLEEGPEESISGEGETFLQAAVALEHEYRLRFDAHAEFAGNDDIWDALTELSESDEDGEHQRRCFSTPEENFNLKLRIT